VHQDDDIQNENLISDDAANKLAGLNATDTPVDQPQAPGQQFAPDPANAVQPLTSTSPIGSDLPDQGFSSQAVPPTTTEDEKPVAEFTPPPDKASTFRIEPEPVAEDTVTNSEPAILGEEHPAPPAPTDPATDQVDEALASVKNKALDELRPLVHKLELPAEKRYDLLMEMIQATDDKTLLDSAYSAATSISDDDLRAQALMEIVNEIEYLEGHKKTE